jgi:hypothetical protein
MIRKFLWTVAVFALGISPACILVPPVHGQSDQLATEAELAKFGGSTRLKFNSWCRGDTQPLETEKDQLVLASKYYIYRVTIKQYQQKPGGMQDIRDEFDSLVRGTINHVNYGKKNTAFRKAFAAELVDRFSFAFKQIDLNKDRLSYVNLALMLPALGDMGEPAVGVFLNKLLKEGKDDIIKMCAMKGLQAHYAVHKPDVQPFLENPVRLAEAAKLEPLIEYVRTTPPELKNAPPKQIAGYQYVRCEAIKALAETRLPGIPLLPGLDGEVKAPVAYWLMAVVAKDKVISPPPSLEERLEAAIGLCRMRNNMLPRYQSKLAAYLVADFLIDYAELYIKDKSEFERAVTVKLPDDKKVEVRLQPKLPWRVHSDRLLAALDDLEKNASADVKANAKFSSFLTTARNMLNKVKYHEQVEDPSLLRDQLREMKTDPTVYQKEPLKITLP